jgi:RNA polymerase sigma-70 factor (ECF subfamily)
VLPHNLAEPLHDVLREHFEIRDDVQVVVERRFGERRSAARRLVPCSARAERRRVRHTAGRRIAERRSVAALVTAPELPDAAQPHADQIVFLQRFQRTGSRMDDIATNRLVARVQAGDPTAIDEIYLRYFDQVYGYSRAMLRDAHEAEDVTQQVFVETLRRLPQFEIRSDQPFRAWLFWLARNRVRDVLRKRSRLDVEEPATLESLRNDEAASHEGFGLDWISDAETAKSVERLPIGQRQVLVLRYLVGMSTEEIAIALERSPTAVRILQHRALRTLERQLEGDRQPSRTADRAAMLIRVRPATVARARRFALVGFGMTPLQQAATGRQQWR